MRRLKQLLPAVSLAVLCLFFSLKSPTFLTPENGFAIANQYAYLLLIGIGATVVIVGGGIDLSVGSVLALSGVVAAHLMVVRGWPIWASGLAGVFIGAMAGLLNALAVTILRVPAFIATLGMLLIARGVTLRIARGVTVDGTPDAFNFLASGRWLGIPVPIYLIVVCAVIVSIVLRHTRFGRYVYAVGSNREATRLSGVPVDRVTVGTYVIGGVLAGLAGLVEAARLGSGNPTGGAGYELDVVTAVVVGGASLTGGEGRISGTFLGALLIAVLRNGANLLGVDPFDQNIYIGLLILGAVALDQRLRQRR
jgi:ribose transport system permease protein